MTLNNIAQAQERLGRLDAAAATYEELIARYRRAGKGRSANAATPISNLAGVHSQQGRLAEAEELAREAVDICGETIGPDAEANWLCRSTLGLVLVRAGKVDGGLTELSAVHERTWREDGPVKMGWRRALLAAAHAEALNHAGRAGEALVHAEEALRASRADVGDEHAATKRIVALVERLMDAPGRAGVQNAPRQ